MTEAPGWTYLVPSLFGSRWDVRGGPLYSAPLDWPTVGIYCPHEPHPWLIGSFCVSPDVLEHRGEIYWRFRREYVTGDGYLISLGRQSGDTGTTQLVGDEVYDRQAVADELARALADHGILSSQAKGASAKIDRANSDLRVDVRLTCGVCTLRRKVRSETVQPIVNLLWRIGMREIDLATFLRRVDNRP